MIIVFARAPVPGRVKTRLIPRLGEWRAAHLHARLVRRALAVAAASNCGPVELHGTTRHSTFRGRRGFALQAGKDLGERMHHAISASLKKHERVILIGADCPELAARDLRRADRLLRAGCDAVIAPAEDGGYALIGLRRCSPLLFEGIAWGGPDVYAGTLRRLERLGWRWRALRTVWDLDRPEDLPRFERMRPGLLPPGAGARSWTKRKGDRKVPEQKRPERGRDCCWEILMRSLSECPRRRY